ncbi:MAG: magnesium transporter [Rhodothermales bacterium]
MENVLLSEEQERLNGAPLEVDSEFVENTAALLASGQRGMVLNLLADLHPADCAQLLSRLPMEEARQLFQWLPVEEASEMLPELDDTFRAALLENASSVRFTALLDHLDTDDAADVLMDLPQEVALQVLPSLEDADDIEALLRYDEESAGGIMATEFVVVPQTWTVAEATEAVRRNAEEVEEIYAVFVADETERLVGTVSLKRLLLSRSDVLMEAIMEADFVTVTTDVDQEEVARLMERYDLVSMPVVDAEGRLVGRITIDDVVDVIREEAEEDIQLMSGLTGGEEPSDSVLRITKGRLPWLLVGMVGAGLSGMVIGAFEEALERAVVLATFIPVVMAMAGNAGIQSSAIAVQGLASGDFWASDVVRRLSKELAVAVINGVALACVLSVAILFLPFESADPIRLAATAGISLVIVIILAACIGATVPLLLHRLGVDPAIATGPFITTSNDILGLAVFFALATLIYL